MKNTRGLLSGKVTESPTAPRGPTLGHSVDLLSNTNMQEMLHFSIFLDQIKHGSACSSSSDRMVNFIIVGSHLSTLDSSNTTWGGSHWSQAHGNSGG